MFVDAVPPRVRFRDKVIADKKIVVPVPEYLLFLKKRPDGNYEFVSGNWDADASVREIHWPLRLPEEAVPVKPPNKK